ncbi:MAG: hypothetical protein U5L96_22210 [Owenweeksia sp.]|nr:hypothetical protein [Owenweeksia sp.]
MRDLNLNAALQMAVFPSDVDGVGGALCYRPYFHTPGHQGSLL